MSIHNARRGRSSAGDRPRVIRRSRRRSIAVAIAIFSFVFGAIVGIERAAIAQSAAGAAQIQSLFPPTSIVSENRIGNLVYAPVILDGRKLFRVAAAAVSDADPTRGETSLLNERVDRIENELYGLIATGFNPETLQIKVAILNGETAIVASDGDRVNNQPIVTVTDLDARIYGFSVSQWARELAEIIHQGTIRAYRERQLPYLLRHGQIAAAIAVAVAVLSLGLQSLEKRLKAKTVELPGPTPSLEAVDSLPSAFGSLSPEEVRAADRSRAIARRQEVINRDRHRNLTSLKQWLLQIAKLLLWVGGIAAIAGLFPWTRWLQSWLVSKPIVLVAIVLFTKLAIDVSCVLVDVFLNTLVQRTTLNANGSQRQALRFSTFSVVLKSVAFFVCATVGTVVALERLDIPLGPILAGAGILGFAISLSSQNFIKDVVNGCLILIEDQYAIGDFIAIDPVMGFVENMNLRVTQLRDGDGHLITIPNGTIAIVRNMSKNWSRVNFTIQVAYDNDIEKVMQILEQVGQQLYDDPEWSDRIIEVPLLLGIDELAHQGITLRVWIKTAPLQQWAVGREYRRRLKLTFDRLGISIGIPQQYISFKSDSNGEVPFPRSSQ